MRIFIMLFAVLVLAVAVTAQAPQPEVQGNLSQIMKSIPFPNSNVIFDTQDYDPTGEIEPSEFAMSAGPRRAYAGAYGSWEAVENAAIAIAEFSSLLLIPGRECANGRPAPLDQPDWPGFVQDLRDAGMVVYEAAQTQSQDEMLNASDVLVTACGNCHVRYRDVPGGMANRCMP